MELFIELYSLKAKNKGVLEGNILAMVTCYIRTITATCLLKILHLYDTVIVESLVN